MPFIITVDDSELRATLTRFYAKALNPRPAMEECSEIMATGVRRCFIEASTPDGAPWKPLALSTLRRYALAPGTSRSEKTRRIARGIAIRIMNTPLMATGEMFNSITPSAEDRSAEVTVTRESESGFDIAEFHNRTRQFLGISGEGISQMESVLQAYIDSHGNEQ